MRILKKTMMVGVTLLMMAACGCTSPAGKVAKRKVKMATPGVDAKGENAVKAVQKVRRD
jgi:ABC-type glycerol-3-phosphate transport system substrate-binding protein